MNYYIHPDLSRLGWWIDHLPHVTELARGTGHPVSDLVQDRQKLQSLADAGDCFDDSLAHSAPSPRLGPELVSEWRIPLQALRKWRLLRDQSYGEAAVARFIQSNADCPQTIPERYVPYMRQRLARTYQSFYDCMCVVGSRFGPGSVAERIPAPDRWTCGIVRKQCGFSMRLPELVLPSSPPTQQGEFISRLCAVPKDWKKDRLITVEPCSLTWRQHAVRNAMLACLAGTGEIDPGSLRRDNPRYHGCLALRGSLDGSLATLDLSDASDRIGYEQLARVMPPIVMTYLDLCRTSQYCYKGPTGPAHRYQTMCYAGMGNATTFSCMTGILWAMCHAVADYHRLGRRFCSVHGDDIVVDARLAKLLIDTGAFEACGWIINKRKSMWLPESRLRESCGVVAFKGVDVSGDRVYGYRQTVRDEFPSDLLSLLDLLRGNSLRFCDLFGMIDADIPNIPWKIPGTVSFSCPWLPWSRVPTRFNHKGNWAQEVQLLSATGSFQSRPAASLGLLLARLVGQFEYRVVLDEGEPLDQIIAPVPYRSRLKPRWHAARDGDVTQTKDED